MKLDRIRLTFLLLLFICTSAVAQNKGESDELTESWEQHIRNTAMNPPGIPCMIEERSIDAFTGKAKITLQSVPFFSSTPEELTERLEQRPFIDGKIGLSRIENTVYLVLEISIATKKTEDLFGELPEEGLLKVKLLSGETVNMVAAKTLKEVPNPGVNRTVFTGYYPVTSSKREALSNSLADKVRVIWEKGYEDYEVYYMDAIHELLHCLEKKSQ